MSPLLPVHFGSFCVKKPMPICLPAHWNSLRLSARRAEPEWARSLLQWWCAGRKTGVDHLTLYLCIPVQCDSWLLLPCDSCRLLFNSRRSNFWLLLCLIFPNGKGQKQTCFIFSFLDVIEALTFFDQLVTVTELQSQNCTSHMPASSDIGRRSTGRSAANQDVNVDCMW